MLPSKTDEGQYIDRVAGELFNARGKWKYSVVLDYTDVLARPNEWKDPNNQALVALNRATKNETSGVTVTHNFNPGSREVTFYLVVTDPPCGFPTMVQVHQ